MLQLLRAALPVMGISPAQRVIQGTRVAVPPVRSGWLQWPARAFWTVSRSAALRNRCVVNVNKCHKYIVLLKQNIVLFSSFMGFFPLTVVNLQEIRNYKSLERGGKVTYNLTIPKQILLILGYFSFLLGIFSFFEILLYILSFKFSIISKCSYKCLVSI